MNKKILTLSGVLLGGIILGLISKGFIGDLSSTVLNMPQTDLSYVTCKKYESKILNKIDYKIYLSSSKKTYAITTDTSRKLDVSSIINAEYFNQQKIALGQNDPTRIKYEVSYTNSTITLLNKIFINDKEFICPDIVLPVAQSTSSQELSAKTPSCHEIVYDLSEEEKKGVKCISDNSFSVEKAIPSTQIVSHGDSYISYFTQLLVSKVYANNSPSTTEAPPITEEPTKKRRCENGVNINTFMNCKCPDGTYTYEKDDYTVVACRVRVGEEKPKKETIRNIIKRGINFGRVELPADRDGQGGEGGWGISGSWEF